METSRVLYHGTRNQFKADELKQSRDGFVYASDSIQDAIAWAKGVGNLRILRLELSMAERLWSMEGPTGDYYIHPDWIRNVEEEFTSKA